MVTLNAIRSKEKRDQQFQAAIQGIEIGGADTKPDENFENVWNRAKNEGRDEKTEEQRFKQLGIAMVNEYGG